MERMKQTRIHDMERSKWNLLCNYYKLIKYFF
jgi:hypothetical protein